jgi:hypothetical protein
MRLHKIGGKELHRNNFHRFFTKKTKIFIKKSQLVEKDMYCFISNKCKKGEMITKGQQNLQHPKRLAKSDDKIDYSMITSTNDNLT